MTVKEKALLGFTLCFLLCTVSVLSQGLQGAERLYILPGGSIEGSITATAPRDGIFTLMLPGQVQAISVSSSLGVAPLYNFTGNTLTFMAREGEAVNITFVSRLPAGDPAQLVIESWNQSLELYIHSNYALLGVEPIPDSIQRAGEYLVLRYSRLNGDLSVSIAEVPSGAQPQQTTPTQPGLAKQWQDVFLFTIAAIAAVVLGYITLRRGKRGADLLGEEDRAIIEFLKSRGGRAYLREIREGLELPSTTALRRVRKLEEKGLVKTDKTPEGLLVVLST
ncbi:winged helix-turn-helix transcriptional regulator [Infirmifilum lucidum]|uniref:Winged helix-turn-helix transcriptional regulator n=1 Tax=Infirmifilum lucidum TaxID=2776706 RepID=A0A7L9FIR3_9CREN|nr:winged helix DNA-binding protein [Infirmifilum lucidum]QOJ78675.1 winged helix-turn-helix transcriptional regulator [Infirmifilum lucidum]